MKSENSLVTLHQRTEYEYFPKWRSVYKKEKRISFAISLIEKGAGLVLDAGCRWGDVTNEIHKNNVNVIGVDFVPKFIDMAKKLHKDINFYVGDLLNLKFEDNTFDVVFIGEVIEHIPNQNKAIQEAYRVLKPKGKLILTTPNIASLRCRIKLLLGKQIDTDEVHFKLLTKKELVNLLERNNFKIELIKGDGIKISKIRLPCFYQNFADIFIVKATKKNRKLLQ